MQADQPDDSSKGAHEFDEEDEEALPPPKIEPPYKFKLSSNQKRRSKLDQHQEPAPAATPEAETTTSAAPAPSPADPPKRVRLKRSGHMHEELREPIPEPPRPADQY